MLVPDTTASPNAAAISDTSSMSDTHRKIEGMLNRPTEIKISSSPTNSALRSSKT